MGTEVEEPRYARQKGGVAPTQMESVAVAIVGGGQAGLATSRELTKTGCSMWCSSVAVWPRRGGTDGTAFAS